MSLACSLDPPTQLEWRALRQRVLPNQEFLASNWVNSWAKVYLPYDRWHGPCRSLTVRTSEGTLTGVLPLATMKFGPFWFRACGGYFLPFRGPVITSNPVIMQATCEALVEALTGNMGAHVGLRIGPYYAHDASTGSLIETLKRRGWCIGVRVLGRSCGIALPRSPAELSNSCGSIVKSAQYYERRMHRNGEVEIKEYRGLLKDEWKRALQDAASIEQASWLVGENGHMIFSGPRDQNFWLLLFRDEFLSSAIAIWVLYFDGKPVTFSLNLDSGGTKYILANLYDETFKDHSPGNILAYHVICNAIENGQNFVDWGQGDSGYKKRWRATPDTVVQDVVCFRPGFLGRAFRGVIERIASGYKF